MSALKPVLLLCILALLPACMFGQTYYPITATSGTQTVSGYNVTISPDGTPGVATQCGTGPYFIGVNGVPSGYIYTFSNPITSARVQLYGINNGEVVYFKVNGNIYPISNSPLNAYAGTCFAPYSVNFVSGNLSATGNPVGSNPGSGVQVTITPTFAFTTFEVYFSTNFGDGCVYNMSFTGNCTNSVSISSSASNDTLCSGQTLSLSSTAVPGASYTWTGPGGFSVSGQTAAVSNIQTSQAGTYTISAAVGSCNYTSNVPIVVKQSPPKPSASSNAPICAGNTLQLNMNSVAGVTYGWAGPNGVFSNQQSFSINNATNVDSGTYIASDTANNGCISYDTISAAVSQALPPPGITITSMFGDTICAGGITTFFASATNASVNATYQWKANGVNIPGATGSSFTPSSTILDNEYFTCVVTSYLSSCQVVNQTESSRITMRVLATVPPPVITITSYPSNYAVGDTVTFTAHCTNAGVNLTLQWMKNGVAVPTATTSSWETKNVAPGDKISVMVTSGFPCASPRTGTSNTINVGVPEVNTSKDDLHLYPNPNNGNLTLTGTLGSATEVTVQIIDIMGRVVYKSNIAVNNNELHEQLNLDAAPGNYFMRVQSVDNVTTIPFSIVR